MSSTIAMQDPLLDVAEETNILADAEATLFQIVTVNFAEESDEDFYCRLGMQTLDDCEYDG